jgi:hypothetical protein
MRQPPLSHPMPETRASALWQGDQAQLQAFFFRSDGEGKTLDWDHNLFDHFASNQHDACAITFINLITFDHRVTECSGT